MTRDQLVARLRVVEGYLSAARELSMLAPEQTGASPVEQDFVAHDALRMLDRSGTPAFIYELDEGLRVLDANYAFAALSGYFGNDLWALCLTDLLDMRPHPRLFRLLSKPRPKGFVETGIWRGRAKNNEERQVIASGHDLVFQGRRARFVVLHSARDQSDPMRAARVMVQALPTPAYLVGPDATLVCANAAFAQLLGTDAERLSGRLEADLLAAGETAIQVDPEVVAEKRYARPAAAPLALHVRSAHVEFDEATHLLRLLSVPTAIVESDPPPAPTPREWRWEQDAALRFSHVADESLGVPSRDGHWLGKTLLELPVRWQAVEDKRRYQHAVQSHQPFQSIELHLPSEGQAGQTLLLSGGPRFDEHGAFLGYHGIARDVSARRTQDAQLQMLTSLLQHTEDAVLALSTDMAVVSWNPGAQQLLGYTRAEILGRRLNVLCADSDGSLFDQVTQVARGGDAFAQRAARARHRDGHEVDVAATCSVVRSGRRRIVGLALVMRDALHTQLPAAALADENTRLRAVLDAAHLHRWELDLEAGRMRYDDSLARMLGYDTGELPEDEGAFAGLIVPADAPRLLKSLHALQAGETQALETTFRVCRQNGEQLWLQARACLAPEVDVDAPRRVLGTCADITASRHREQSRRVYGALAEAAGAVIFSLALDGLILSWSPGAEAALGYRAAEVIGSYHDRMLPGEARSQHEDALRQLQSGAANVKLSTQRRHRDDSLVALDCVLAPIRDDGGALCEIAFMGQTPATRPGSVSGTHTARKDDALAAGDDETIGYQEGTGDDEATVHSGEATSALATDSVLSPAVGAAQIENQRVAWHLARVVESCRDAIISFTPAGLIESFNLSAEKLLGFEREEVIALPLAQVFDGAFVTMAQAALEHGGQGQSIANQRTQLRRRDGTVIHLLADFFPVVDEGRVAGAACILRESAEPAHVARAPASGDVRFRTLVEATHQAVWIANAQGDMVTENPSWQRYTGQSLEESRGRGWFNAIHPEDREHAALRWNAALAGSTVYECPQRVQRFDGQWRDMIARAVPVRGEDGSVQEWIGIHIDLTEQRNTEDALRESESRLQSILNSAAEGIVVVDHAGSIERMNVAAQRMFGCQPEDYRALELKQLIVELDREFEGENTDLRYAAWLRRMIGSQRDLTGVRKDAQRFPLELSVNEVSEAGYDTRFVAIVRDVTERKSWEARIFQLAYSDSLTGLPNRLLLVDRLEQAVAGAQRNRTQVGVLFFDFDGFKQVNDRYGHHTGDLLLKGMSERIRNCVREIDTVSRLGGDEFVVVLPELKDGADAGAVARKIIAALSQPYSIEHQEISITLTAGISVYPEDGESAEILIRHADTAMYFAKESGKNRFRFFNPGIQSLH